MGQVHFLPLISSHPPVDEQPGKVLIVVDELEAGASVAQLCRELGFQPQMLQTPAAALTQSLHVTLIVVLLSDTQAAMELCGELRETDLFHHTSTLLLSKQPATPELAARALLAGADDYCSADPRWNAELGARLQVHMRRRRFRDAVLRLRTERNDLRFRVSTDSLTGVLTRSMIEKAVAEELSRSAPFAILFVDIDHFKRVNDEFGHQMGDQVLQRVASVLSMGCRSGDSCGRYGGEEFVLVLSQVDREKAARVAERHREVVETLSFATQRGPERVTISIGVADFDPHKPDVSAAALLKRADAALYQAKDSGRNCVVVAPTLGARRAQTKES